MDDIQRIVGVLNKGERQILRKYFDTSDSKMLKKFFELKTKPDGPSDVKIRQQLFRANDEKNYSQLKTSFKDTILKVIIAQNDFTKFDSYRALQKYRGQKNNLIGHFLYQRGLFDIGTKYLNKSASIARKNEFLEIELQALEQLKERAGARQGVNSYMEISARQKEVLEKFNQRIAAQEVYKTATLQFMGEVVDNKKTQKALEKAIVELQKLEVASDLKTIAYWKTMSITFFHYCVRDFEAGYNNCLHLLEFIGKYKWLGIDANVAGVNMQMGTFCICMNKTEKAIEHIQVARKKFKKGQFNIVLADETIVQALIHGKQEERALVIIGKALRNNLVRKHDIRKARWYYYKAVIHFNLNEFKMTLSSLSKAKALLNEKSGWYIGHRMLELMSLYEHNGPGFWDSRLINLGRVLRQGPKLKHARAKLIHKVMAQLEKERYNFDVVATKMKKELSLLEDGEEKYFWDPTSYEVVRFDTWFRSHLK